MFTRRIIKRLRKGAAVRALKRKRRGARASRERRSPVPNRAAVGAPLTFRAELMLGRGRSERTFTVARVHGSGRVELMGLAGEHAESEFEAAR